MRPRFVMSGFVVAAGCVHPQFHPHPSTRLWSTDAVGVLVAGGRHGQLDPQDIISTVDDVPVVDAFDAYRMLSDGHSHRLSVRSPHGTMDAFSIHIDPTRALDLSLVGTPDLLDVPEAARGPRWGFVNPSSTLFGETQSWALPSGLAGDVFVIVDVPRGQVSFSAMQTALAGREPSGFAVFALRVTRDSGYQSNAWTDEETRALASLDWIVPVTTPWNVRRPEDSTALGFAFGLPVAGNMLVVDCHGVVRWHAEVPNVDDGDGFARMVGEGLDFASRIQGQTECWRPPTEPR